MIPRGGSWRYHGLGDQGICAHPATSEAALQHVIPHSTHTQIHNMEMNLGQTQGRRKSCFYRSIPHQLDHLPCLVHKFFCFFFPRWQLWRLPRSPSYASCFSTPGVLKRLGSMGEKTINKIIILTLITHKCHTCQNNFQFRVFVGEKNCCNIMKKSYLAWILFFPTYSCNITILKSKLNEEWKSV